MRKTFLWLLLFIIFFLVVGFSFKINVVHCRISGASCSSEFYKKLEVLKGKSLFFVNFNKELTAKEFKSEPILLENYQKQFPETVILNFNEEKAFYQLNFGENHYFVSEFGNILQTDQEKENLTQVNWEDRTDNLVANRSIDQDQHLKIAKIINRISESKMEINNIDWENEGEIIIRIKDSPKIIIDVEAIDTKINTLGLLLGSKEIKDYHEPIKEIDLRFNLPVLRTTQ